MNLKRHSIFLVAASLFRFIVTDAWSQTAPAALTNGSQSIVTGSMYQPLLSASAARRSITIENNNASDSCYIDPTGTVRGGDTTSTNETVGGKTITAAKASILLLAGGSWTRYYPFIPSNSIVGTCATTGDGIYVDTQ